MQLSVIIPMYNAEKYIKRCIESVYRQDLDINNFELLVVNDGSTDNSPSIVKELQKIYPNITLIDKENGGQGSARNIGIDSSSGDYLMFIDADDYLVDKTIKDCLKKTEENNLDICCMCMQRLSISGLPDKVNTTKFSETEIYTGSYLLLHDYFPGSVCAHFFKREFLLGTGLYFLTDIMHEDVDFQMKLLFYVHRLMFCHTIVYIYYYNPESTDRLMDVKKGKYSILSTLRTCKDIIDFSETVDVDSKLKSYYKKVSNSQVLAMCLTLFTDNTLNMAFKRKAIVYAFVSGLLPIKGACFSWKSKFLKYFVNFWCKFQF